MVEYAGMLISASAAQRRQFFAAMIQRGAKLHRRLGGGSLTMLGCLPGTPATGIQKKKQATALLTLLVHHLGDSLEMPTRSVAIVLRQSYRTTKP